MKFEELNLSRELQEKIKKLNFTEPTKIQAQSIPLILKHKDVIGESATGSGKTLAFATGIIENTEPNQTIQALVLVPTRELAEQVKDDIKTLTNDLNLLAIYGGVSIDRQIKKIPTTDVVIATPGRLLDHLNRQTINLSNIKILILDEADRMVEMGFIEDVERIISACPKNRQTLLFSATMYAQAEDIAHKHMKNPTKIRATKMVDPTKLKQCYYDVPQKFKNELLVNLLKKEDSDLVMVFCNTRRSTDYVSKILRANKIKAAAIHGGHNQPKRLKTIEQFHKGKFSVLVCTDVAARGLDIQCVTHIYNYDIPTEVTDYVHRIGRTARAGSKGRVINILARRDYDSFSKIINFHRDYNIESMERPYLKHTINMPTKRHSRKNKHRRNYHHKRRR
jgi:ATP-dependent RNA helicase DeaD